MSLLAKPTLPTLLFAVATAVTITGCGSSGTQPPASTDSGPPSGDAASPLDSSVPVEAAASDASGQQDSAASEDSATAADAADAGPIPDAEVLAEGGDYGSVSTTYPAFTVDYPQVIANQGYVLPHPVIVTITWPGDTNTATWQGFADGLGATSYWSAATAEYGVGPTSSVVADHIVLTEPAPTTITADALAAFVQNNVGAKVSDAGPAWPAPSLDPDGGASQTIYSLFIPPSMTVTDPGSGTSFCTEGAGGYHDNVLVDGKPISYAINLFCTGMSTTDVEETAAHEYAEAVTDPYPSYPNTTNSNPTELGYVGFDQNHLSWDVYTGFQSELGDACEFWGDSYYEVGGGFPYYVQRIWSNKAALSGHAPCAPQVVGAYTGMTLFPSQESDINIDLTSQGLGVIATKGFHALVNQSLTFQVGFFSDEAAAAWTIGYDFPATTQLYDNAGNPTSNGTATVTIDHGTGENGNKAYVTITPTAVGALGFQIMAITWDQPASTSPFLWRYLPILILNQ